MAKCPWCGSTAQAEVIKEEYHEDGWTIKVIRYYRCGCGTTFSATSWYHSDGIEEIEPCLAPKPSAKPFLRPER